MKKKNDQKQQLEKEGKREKVRKGRQFRYSAILLFCCSAFLLFQLATVLTPHIALKGFTFWLIFVVAADAAAALNFYLKCNNKSTKFNIQNCNFVLFASPLLLFSFIYLLHYHYCCCCCCCYYSAAAAAAERPSWKNSIILQRARQG